jgi:hypothetical protein
MTVGGGGGKEEFIVTSSGIYPQVDLVLVEFHFFQANVGDFWEQYQHK